MGCSTNSTPTRKGREIDQKLLPMTTMTTNESSPLFHDASQGASPDQHPANTAASTSVLDSSVENTPIGQRCLFPASVDVANAHDDNVDMACVDRLYTQSQELDLCLVEDDKNEEGDDGSNCDAAEVADLVTSYEERLEVLMKEDCNDLVGDHEGNMTLVVKGLGAEVSVYSEPDDWLIKKPKRKTEAGEPESMFVDNPGNWSDYTYRPKFAAKAKGKDIKKGQYTHHALPTGAMPVPADTAGNRKKAGWDFYYDKWYNPEETKFQSGASHQNPFPASNRKGQLDYDLLKKMGLTKSRLLSHDALFFWQLLFPICDPALSGIPNDPRLPFYSEVERWSMSYAASLGLGGSYGHDFKQPTSKELLHFDMVVVRDGVLGGMQGAIYRRWKKSDSAYDPEISGTITHIRWVQIKRVFKLCDNAAAPKKGENGYDPSYKYDYVYLCLVSNTNELTLFADLDLCGDETTCGHGGFGEAGSGILARCMNKPGITFGMQRVLLFRCEQE